MISEFRNIFELYDKKKKGYLTREEFIKSLSGLYHIDIILNRMKSNGCENDRYITIDKFIKLVKLDTLLVPKAVLDNLRELYKEKYKYNEMELVNRGPTMEIFHRRGTMRLI